MIRRLAVSVAILALAAAPAAEAQHGGHGGGGGGSGRPAGGGGGHGGGDGHFGGGGPGGGAHVDGGSRFGGMFGGHQGGFGERGGGFADHGNAAGHGFAGGHGRALATGAAIGAGVALAAHGGFHGGERSDAHAASGFRAGPGFERRDDGFAYAGDRGGGQGFHGRGAWSYRGRTFGRFQAAPFRYPGGWGYRRWSAGAFLPALFLTDAYFIGDFNDYDLGPPPARTRWVRYGPDALLVDVDTGEVIDVAYGVFWW